MIKLEQMLKAREERAARQREYIGTYNCALAMLTLNIPGPIKKTPMYDRIHKEGMKCLYEHIGSSRILFAKVIYPETGGEGYICTEMEPITLKRLTVKIESEHPLGRIYDIDVFNCDWTRIDRETLGFSARRCLICNEDAKLCSRSKKHQLEEIVARIDTLASDYFEKA